MKPQPPLSILTWLRTNGVCVCVLALCLFWIPLDSHANSALTTLLCDVVYIIQDDIGKAAATGVVASLGILAMFGKISWTMVLAAVTGGAIMFSSAEIVMAMTGETQCAPH